MTQQRDQSGADAERVLVIFPGALGDLICLGPALRALARRHRGASLELMARHELAQFAVGRIGVAAGHSIDRREMSQLFGASDDAGADARRFFGGFRSIYSFFAAAHQGFRESLTQASQAKLSFHPFRADDAGHVAAAWLRAIGEPADSLESRLDLLPEDIDTAARGLRAHGLDAQPFALLLPGSGGAGKNWPPEKFTELAGRLEPRIKVAIALGPTEAGMRQSFAARGGPVLANLELGTLAGTAARAAIFVGNDSGVSHLAAAAGAPGIALFGPSDPERWRPLGRVTVLHRSPLTALDVAEVAAAASAMLAC